MSIQHGASVTENMFLTLSCSGFDYAIPLIDVGHISDSVPEGAFAVGNGNGDMGCCVITSAGGMTLAILADEIYGLRYFAPDCQFEIPPEVRSEDNYWIFGVIHDKAEGRPYFMPDCSLLAEHISDKNG